MRIQDKFYINGQWVEPAGQARIDVLNPTTEAVIGQVVDGTQADADNAVQAARHAFDAWSVTSAQERSSYLDKISKGLQARMDEIAALIATEVGMPLKMAKRIQAASPIGIFSYYAGLVADFDFEAPLGNSLVAREPVGVVACITPWNYPLHQIAAKVAAALAAGCTVVLKPSEVAPLNAYVLAEVIHEAGLPPGVFNLVCGYGNGVGEHLAAHPDVDMVSFTGSTTAGKRVSVVASANLKRVALELGGKSAAIVLDDADVPSAVKGVLNACFLNSGQTCSAHTRLLVPEAMYGQVSQLATELAASFTLGDPMEEGTKLGPLVSAVQRERVRGHIEVAIADGAELLCGGAAAPAGLPAGYYVQPTVLGRVDPDSALAQEEVFGPVLAIMTYRDEDEAVSIANNTIYGLSGGVWSSDDERALAVAKRLRTGQVDINGGSFNAEAPFGGYRQSGNGRELGRYGLEEFLEYKAIQRSRPKK